MPVSLQLREQSEEQGKPQVLEGYALKFGVRSVPLDFGRFMCYEVLEPGCVTREMLMNQRIYFTMHHNREMILGRWDKGNGTLRLEPDATGLHISCEIPSTFIGDNAREMVSRGDLSEMSFAYWTDEEDKTAVSYERTDETTDDGTPIYIRHVHRIDWMFDVTIAATPAFEDTEIKTREAQMEAVIEQMREKEAGKDDDKDDTEDTEEPVTESGTDGSEDDAEDTEDGKDEEDTAEKVRKRETLREASKLRRYVNSIYNEI